MTPETGARRPVKVEPFRISVSDAVLADLRERLERSRPASSGGPDDWSYGVLPGFLQRLVKHWLETYSPFVEARTGLSWFTYELPPGFNRDWASALYNVVFANSHERGGHFAPVEQPDAVVADIRDTFRLLRRVML